MFAFDPSGVVSYRLFKEHITWKDGMFIKDLSKLNRDLSRVIMIDDNAEGFSMNQDNGVLISTWDKSPKDQALMEALPLLIDIQRNDVQDTREVIRGLGGGNVARKYLESFKEKNEKESKAPEKAPSKSLLGKFSR